MGSLEESWESFPFMTMVIGIGAFFVVSFIVNTILVWRNGSEARNLAAARLEETGLRCAEMEIRIDEAKQRLREITARATLAEQVGERRAEADRLNVSVMEHRVRETGARAQLAELAFAERSKVASGKSE